MTPAVIAAVVAIVFFATFTRSALGFGDALLAMPLLGLVIGFRAATPLMGLVATTIATGILLEGWRSVDLRATWRLILSSLAGIPLGLLLLKGAPEDLVKALLGVLLVAFGLFSLIQPRLPRLGHPVFAYLFGFVAGILGGAYNTNGPPVVVYGALQGWPAQRFRATLQGYFLPTGLLILAGHALSGLWTLQVFQLYLYALPLLLLAMYLGGKANRALPKDRFRQALYGALVVFGIVLVA